MSPTSTKTLRWFNGLSYSARMVLVIISGAAMVLATLFSLVQKNVSLETAETFASFQDINSKIALSDEIRIRSSLASLDKVLLILRKDYEEKPGLTLQQLQRRMDELQIDQELSPRTSIIDAQGNVVLSTARDFNGFQLNINVADREYFQKHKSNPNDRLYVGTPIQSRVTGNWVVPLTRRINRLDGSFGGIVNITVDPNFFTEPFAQTSMGPDATRALMGRDGFTLVRLNGGKLVFGGDTRKSQLYQELEKAPAGCYTAVASSDGIRRSVCYRAVDPYDIVILAGTSVTGMEKVASDNVQGYMGATTAVAVLVVVLSGVLIVGVLRQRKLLASQQSFNQLIELVPQSICRMNAQGIIVWANRRTIDFARPSDHALAQGFDWVTQTVHPDDQGPLQEFVSHALLQHANAQTCEYRKRRFDGAYLWYSLQITQIVGVDGADDFYLLTSTDVHDQKLAQERTRLTQKLESIGQLTGGLAHDFNNLLAIVLGNLDLVKEDIQASAATRRLDVAIGAAQRGVDLVKSLLALASKQPLMPAVVNVWSLVERISPLLSHALGKRVHFVLNPPNASIYANVDASGLEAVLLNLIVNARDAMPQGGDVNLGLHARNGLAHIVVTDNGTGMSDAVLQRAAEPFFTTKERGLGTGLGLAMVAGFAKQSGGAMTIQSTEGLGTIVDIALPLAPGADPDLSQGENVTVPSQPTISPPKQTILIVDDEPALAELVQAWATAEGHTAVVAHSADAAIKLLAVSAFDVLLSDIVMPGQFDGIELAEKANLMQPAMKIVLMSGYSKATATHRAEVPWPLLVKPFSKEAFVTALSQR